MAHVQHTSIPAITAVEHCYPTTRHPITTRFARWLNDNRQRPNCWLVKQNDGYVTNVYDAVPDDFGTLVPVQQVAGFISNNGQPVRFLGGY